MKGTLVVLCAVLICAIALPTPILEPRFQAGAPANKKAMAAQAQDRAAKLTAKAGKLPASSIKRSVLLKKAEKAQMDFEQYTAEAATDELVPAPQVVGFGTERLPDAQVPGEVPKTLLTNKEVDIVARNVLANARKNVCNKKGEYCDLRLMGEFKKAPKGGTNMAKWKQEFLAKQGKLGKKGKKDGKKGKKDGKKGKKDKKGKKKGKKGKKAKAKAKAKKDAKKGKKDAKKAKKDAKKAKALAKKGAVKAAKEMKKASTLRKKASSTLKKAAKANKKGKTKKAKKLEKKAKKQEKKAKTQEKKAKKDANKVPKTKEACVKQKGKWDDKAKKCTLKKK